MKGIAAYQLPQGLPSNASIVDIGGFAYIFLPTEGVFMNLEASAAKFRDWPSLDKYMADKGVTTWQRPSQST